MRLITATEEHLRTLMTWLPDLRQCRQWGGPTFRYPFTEQTFIEDCRWPDLPSCVLLDEDGESLAFGQYYERRDRCHLGRLIVSPGHRGAGLGRTLVTELSKRGCRELNARECSLFVLKDNTRARKLYEKLGFAYSDYPDSPGWLEGCDYMIAPAEALTAA
ncbi:GNAT family N-acetyltransferase [Microbulbifer taiwanensis]|uniref:GNAT family N-acetyltransferase n=1 Tax=Microbulbifer taiwanensis TaxID=986746 RepID=A0ABW1YMM7_9GAMM|nr:GNAT family N-acetyltransferase [Microbulbifer taiwanensis]